MPAEPLPVKEFLDELDAQWNASNVVEPRFIEVTGSTNDPLRYDLNVKDVVVGKAGTPAVDEFPIGNWKYGNRTYNIELEVHTNSQRQRLYDIIREIRKLCHARMHSLTNFHRIRFVSFNELTQQQVNVWSGIVNIQLENSAILLETT
tara:strand:- start:190 stop:633 length:444 start_codon:yes stop_codon:yes gene_type:complete